MYRRLEFNLDIDKTQDVDVTSVIAKIFLLIFYFNINNYYINIKLVAGWSNERTGDIDTLATTGVVYLDQANYREIIKYYDKAIWIDPNMDTYLKQRFFIDSLKNPILLYGDSMLVSDVNL